MSDVSVRIRILCVDDHPVVLQGISGFINVQPDMDVVAEAGNGRAAIEQFRKHKPDIYIA